MYNILLILSIKTVIYIHIYTDLNDSGTVFNSDKIFESNVLALNGAFFKIPE